MEWQRHCIHSLDGKQQNKQGSQAFKCSSTRSWAWILFPPPPPPPANARVTCREHMRCNKCTQHAEYCQWVSFQWLILYLRIHTSCPEVLLSNSAPMLVSAAVTLTSLVITKRTSNLNNALCNYLCSLSSADIKGYTAVHTFSQPEAAASSWVCGLLSPSTCGLLTLLPQAPVAR